METAISKIAAELNWKESEVAIIKNSVAKNTTDGELAFFLFSAKAIGLNPILKEIWCYKDNKGNLIIFAGRDGFLSIAHKNKSFGGMRSCEVRENDEFQINIAENKINHLFGAKDRGKIIGAYAIVWKKNCEPTIEWVDFATYDKGYNTWKSHPADMIKKVAESHALKKAFGISGIQSESDFEIISNTVFPLNNNLKNFEDAKITEKG